MLCVNLPWLVSQVSAAAAATTGIKEYLASKNRHSLIWGQDWQPAGHNKDADKMS